MLPSHWIRFCIVHRDMVSLLYVFFNASKSLNSFLQCSQGYVLSPECALKCFQMAKILFALFTGIWFLSCMCSSRPPSHWIRFCSVHSDMVYLQYVLFNASLVQLFSCVDPQMKRILKSLPSCMPTCDKTFLTCFHERIHKGEKPYMRWFNLSFLQVLAHWLKRWKAQWEKSRQKTQLLEKSLNLLPKKCPLLRESTIKGGLLHKKVGRQETVHYWGGVHYFEVRYREGWLYLMYMT